MVTISKLWFIPGYLRPLQICRSLLIIICILCNGYINPCYAQESNGVRNTAAESDQDTTSNAESFSVITASSVLRVYVGRAGILAAMGHNHVVSNRNISGEINDPGQRQQANARLRIALLESVVDDPQERARAGSGYDSMPDESAKQATRQNMLGPDVLDAGQYPHISIDISPSSDQGQNLYNIDLNFKGQEINLELPATVTRRGDRIIVQSNFVLAHDELGLKPFSAMGGLLKVADSIRFELYIEAERKLGEL